MKISSAPTTKLILISFAVVTLIIVFGAAFYKYNGFSNLQSAPDNRMSVADQTYLERLRTVDLKLVPTAEENEFQLVVSNLTEPVTTVAFQFTASRDEQTITSTDISIDPALEQSGWSTVINTSSNSGTGQVLSFSMVRTGIDNRQTTPEIILGTITLSNRAARNHLSLNPEESFITYSTSEEPVRLRLQGTEQ